jgi:hypothetical protein
MARRVARRAKSIDVPKQDGPGAPRKLTPDRMDTIVALIAKGNYMQTACSAAGISTETVRVWLNIAREARDAAHHPENPVPIPQDLVDYVGFLERLERAQYASEENAVNTIHAVIDGGWVSKRKQRVLPDGSVENELEYAGPDGRLALEFLARRDPERWGKTPVQRVELTGAGGGPVQVDTGPQVVGLAERLALQASERAALEGVEDAEVVGDEVGAG